MGEVGAMFTYNWGYNSLTGMHHQVVAWPIWCSNEKETDSVVNGFYPDMGDVMLWNAMELENDDGFQAFQTLFARP